MNPRALCLIFLLLSSCSTWKYDQVLNRKPPNPEPPGTVWLKDNLYIDETEIPTVAWREYIDWTYRVYVEGVKIKKVKNYVIDERLRELKDSCCHPEKYYSQLPDTLSWYDLIDVYGSKNIVFLVDYYFRYPPYDYYPMVGISYEQAQAFCKWRSDRVMEMYAIKYGKENEGKKYPRKVTYRLPSEAEWEYAASGGLDIKSFPYGYERLHNKNGNIYGCTKDYITHYREFTKGDSMLSKNDIMVEVYSFSPNRFGLYNMIGNVAEMIDQKGIAKGGSFINSLEESTIKSRINYTYPECWLGFRCICEVEW